MIIEGWALADRGDCEKGTAEIQKGIRTLRETGAKRSLPYYLSLLAEAFWKSGRAEEGLEIILEAFNETQNINEHWWEAELYRLKGVMLLEQPTPDEKQAEDSFQQALRVARRQHSLLLEIRAATSLCRLRHKQGTPNDARQMLAEVYNRLTEGFDTPDLMEAKDLLHE